MNMTERLGRRYNELMAEGKRGREATDIVNREYGTHMSYATLRGYGSLAKKKQGERDIERSQSKALTTMSRPEESSGAFGYVDSEMESEIRQIVRDEIMGIRRDTPTAVPLEMPPAPESIKGQGPGRRQNRKYKKASLTVDLELWNRFVQEARERGIPAARLMDAILWNHYGRPPLSYECNDHSIT